MSDLSDHGTNGRGAGDELMIPDVRAEYERGLRFAHQMMDLNLRRGNAAVALAQALANVLLQNNVIPEEQLKAALAEVEKQLADSRAPRVRLADWGDKYAEGLAVEIDCASRIPLCQARCCSFFFFLTKQDLAEGAARWDYGNPYWIKRAADGYCIHCEPGTRVCNIHAKRPHVCRQFDCRKDKRVWLDFEQRIPAPMPEGVPDMRPGSAEVAMWNWRHSMEKNEGNTASGG